MAHYSDEELLEMFHKGDNANYSFNLIVRKYQQPLYWHIRRLVIVHEDTDDILQDVFVKAWNALGKFRGDSGLYTWLYRIATNEALSFLKKKKNRFFLPLVDVENYLNNRLEADPWMDPDAIEKKITQAILSLPEKQRVVFNMRYFDEMKYEDMSKILDTSEGALKASYHHAVKKIEIKLKS
ncbi:MAG: sigma-70 family RNA polymerase sigma factor [Bacteroidales bacterium]